MSLGAVVLAAGRGTRYGMPKQSLTLGGRYYWEIARSLAKKVTNDIIVMGVDETGGMGRQTDVFLGISALDVDRVLILEAARPLVTLDVVQNLLAVRGQSVAVASPSVYTIYDTEREQTIPRKNCVDVHVPQVFDKDVLIKAYGKVENPNIFTSDTELVEHTLGIKPVFQMLTPQDVYKVMKVTYPYDALVAERIYLEDLRRMYG